MVITVVTALFALLDTKNVAVSHLHAASLRAPCESRLVNAVRSASRRGERNRLATRVRGELYLWYGNPDYPSGRIPFDIDRHYQDKYPETRAIYRIIGRACNLEINAADRFPFAGTGAGCDRWHPSEADRAAAPYVRCYL